MNSTIKDCRSFNHYISDSGVTNFLSVFLYDLLQFRLLFIWPSTLGYVPHLFGLNWTGVNSAIENDFPIDPIGAAYSQDEFTFLVTGGTGQKNSLTYSPGFKRNARYAKIYSPMKNTMNHRLPWEKLYRKRWWRVSLIFLI